MKSFIKKFIPASFLQTYHYALAVLANWLYGRPSEKMVVIGVTGTSGKSTTIEFISSILEEAGFIVGVTSTIKFKIGKDEKLNDQKMTMVGRFGLQKFLSDMVRAACQYAIIETTSEGIRQFRHIGIHYDVVVFTNLYPEHIDSHGSFENYKNEKLKLFRSLGETTHKMLNGKKIPKIIIVNLDNEYAPLFLASQAHQKIGITLKARYDITGVDEIRAEPLAGQGFRVDGKEIFLNSMGEHNICNAFLAYAVGISQNIFPENIKKGIEAVRTVPGRQEFIDEGQPFTIIVDYAFEPVAMQKLYDMVKAHNNANGKIIHVLGTTGGGRDTARGSILGKMAGEFADIVIATNEDPYDDDPRELALRIARGAQLSGKKLGENLSVVLDRRDAIQKALNAAQNGDIVLITGKGCEQAIIGPGGKKIPWDDRRVVREEL